MEFHSVNQAQSIPKAAGSHPRQGRHLCSPLQNNFSSVGATYSDVAPDGAGDFYWFGFLQICRADGALIYFAGGGVGAGGRGTGGCFSTWLATTHSASS